MASILAGLVYSKKLLPVLIRDPLDIDGGCMACTAGSV